MPSALITGATAGLGHAFAHRLAVERYDLVLVARDGERLGRVAAELEAGHGVRVEVLPADLTDPAGTRAVADRLGGEPVDLLVNNAGMGLGGRFVQRDAEASATLTRLNVMAVLELTHAALAAMLPRGRGDVLNVSSVAAFTPGARDGVYGASKAWVVAFSEALHAQHQRFGVRVSVLCPGFVHTEFHDRAGLDMSRIPERMWLDVDRVVEVGLRDLRAGRAISVPGAQWKVIVALGRHAPRGLLRRAARAVGTRTR